MYFDGVYILPVKKWLFCGHKYSNWAFSPFGSSIPCVIHSRLFQPSSLLFPLFCLFNTLGIRHFSPSTMSLQLKLGTVGSCGELCRPLGGWSNWCPCWPTYTLTTDLPCLVFCSCGWLHRGKIGDEAPSLKSYAIKKTSTQYFPNTRDNCLVVSWGVFVFCLVVSWGVFVFLSLFFVLSKPLPLP